MPLTINLIMAILNVFAPLLIYVALLSQTPGVRWGAAAASFVLLYFVSAFISVCFRKRMLNTLYEDCDPEKLISYCRKTVEHPLVPLKHKHAIYETRLIYATGLLAAGRFEGAVGMLNNVMPFPRTSKGELLEIMRSGIKIELLMHFKESARAQEEFESVKRRAKELAARRPRWSGMLGSLSKEYDLQFRIEDGDDICEEEYHISLFKEAKNAYSKVAAKYELGIIYARSGQTEKAEEALKYAVENGNKLYIAKEAKGLLSEIKQNYVDNAKYTDHSNFQK